MFVFFWKFSFEIFTLNNFIEKVNLKLNEMLANTFVEILLGLAMEK